MRTLSLAAICLSISTLTGCQAMMYGTASDLNKVSLGMSKPEVIAALGQPTTASGDGTRGEEKLTYKRMAQTIGWMPHLYEVTLVNGKVARYGEVQ